jgi:hypothetical protein
MVTPVIHERDGNGEEKKPASLITAKLYDTTMKWLPIHGYEGEDIDKKIMKRAGK